MKLLHWFAGIIFPPKCVLCRKILEKGESDLCRCCRMDAPEYSAGKRRPQFVDSFAAVWYYEGSVRGSLLRFKFRGARAYAESYGRLLAMKLLSAGSGDFDVLTWVPVSRMRKFRRGYDQVELIAKALGRELGVTPVPLLKKIRNNPQQSRIVGAAQRRANVLGVYQITDPKLVSGRRILLLDDILTTGATVSEASRVLLTAGAKEVHCAAVAAARK